MENLPVKFTQHAIDELHRLHENLELKEDSVLRKILSDLYSQRVEYKNTSYEYFTKADNLKKRLT